MATDQKKITDALRKEWTETFKAFISEHCDTDVCQTAAGTLMFPVVDEAGEDRWVKLSIIIPKEASEENGTDGYTLAQEYDLKLQAAAERKTAKEKASAEKAAKAAKKAAR